MTYHITTETIASIQKHLGTLFAKIETTVIPAAEHDGVDGEPVEAVQVNELIDIYPHQTPKGVRWALDIQVDASDHSVGIVGTEPRPMDQDMTFPEALTQIAIVLVEKALEASLQAEAEDLLPEG